MLTGCALLVATATAIVGVVPTYCDHSSASFSYHQIVAAIDPDDHNKNPLPLHYLDPTEFEPARLLPAPPAGGSAAEARELAHLHELIASAGPERLAQAQWDGDHEDPSLYNAVLGRDLAALPHTWALLSLVQQEADTAAQLGKRHFQRLRPWGIDPTMPVCGGRPSKSPVGSYPSGHAAIGWAIGTVLSRLLPERAPDILSRAADYAESRQYCGTHFASDTEASHALGLLAATRLLEDPRLAPQIAAARAELTAR